MASIVKGGVLPSSSIPTPMSEERVRLLLRMPAGLKARLVELAQREHRSLNKQIEFLLEHAIQEGAKEEARPSPRQRIDHGKHK